MAHPAAPVRFALTVAVAGLALAGCSSTGGGGSAPTPGGTPVTTTPSTAPPAAGGQPSASQPPTATPTASAPGTPAAPAVAACSGAQLKVSGVQAGGAMGHIGARVVFTNSSGSACTLHGFPGVAALDAGGAQQVQAKRVTSGYLGSAPVSTVLLAPGAKASALVGGVDVPSGNATSCPSYPALLVTPPGTKTSSKVALALPGCPTLIVYPVVAGVPAA